MPPTKAWRLRSERKSEGMDHHSRVKEEFKRQAETLSVAHVFTDSDVLDRICTAVHPTKKTRILDLGCGPGIVTAALARQAKEVVAYDLTPEMLDKARQRCEEAKLKNVRFELGRAEALPFEEKSFDCVVTRLTIHHFPDPRRVVNEMVRVLREKGKAVIADIVSSEIEEEAVLQNALETLRDPTHVGMLSLSRLEELLEKQGMRITSKMTWEMKRDFDEWMRITNAPERVKPLYTVMATLAKAGIQAGIRLHWDGQRVIFDHRWVLLTAVK